jgi:glycosyltransferase involved in cell wall biosynthesis
VGWDELRDLYQWSDVFLATPLAEEGFYMPGLEAMAAGAVVVSPDAGGNRAYCRFGENCVRVEFGDAAGYVAALRGLKEADPGEIERLRRSGLETAGLHTLAHERERFGEFMGRLTGRLDASGGRGRP